MKSNFVCINENFVPEGVYEFSKTRKKRKF